MLNRTLISGCGSIGKRHARNLHELGIKSLAVCDPSREHRAAVAKELGCQVYENFEQALTEEKPNVVFICSPTKFHIEQAQQATRSGAHLFIEKPLSHLWTGIEELQRTVDTQKLTCMIGCNMRFHHGPRTVKKLLEKGAIGAIKRAEVYTGSYLPDWRPQQDYRTSYSADPEQGGAILDCIHELDLALWYFGPASLKHAMKEPATSIGLTVEGTADLILAHESGIESHVHLSFVEPTYQRFCRIEGTKGSITWDIHAKKVDVLDKSGAVTDSIPEPKGYSFDQCYKDEITHFLRCVEDQQSPEGNLTEAMGVLALALNAKAITTP